MLHVSPALTAYLLGTAAVVGAVLGSFLNCMAWRIVHGESVMKGRSHCAVCGHVLGPFDLVPVLSYLALRGRCRYCGEKISPRYMFTELVCGFLYVTLLLRFDVTPQLLYSLWLMTLLFAASLVDLEAQWIPDRFLICAAVGFLPLAYLTGGTDVWLRGLIGAAALVIPLTLLVLLADHVMGCETMGGGDLKLIAVLGLYFGWQQGLLLIILSCLIGLAFAGLRGAWKPQTETPFGPSLAAAAYLTFLFGDGALRWYLGLF